MFGSGAARNDLGDRGRFDVSPAVDSIRLLKDWSLNDGTRFVAMGKADKEEALTISSRRGSRRC